MHILSIFGVSGNSTMIDSEGFVFLKSPESVLGFESSTTVSKRKTRKRLNKYLIF
jgi:hypothetical protein